jgi:hypothetical protein
MSKNKIKTKQKTGNDIAVEYRNIATDAVKMLKSIPFYDVKQRITIDELFDRLADNDMALQAIIRAEQIVEMGKVIEAQPETETK